MPDREPIEVQVLRARLHALKEARAPAAGVFRERLAAAQAAAQRSHLLFVPLPTGYAIVEHEGPAPAVGGEVEVDGRCLVVLKLGRSPLPGDSRRCAYLGF